MADRVTVIRDGSYVGTQDIREASPNGLIGMMVGRTWEDYYVRHYNCYDETVFLAEGLTKHGVFRDISFHVGKGEVVGFSGLVGAGRSEIMLCVYGADSPDSGTMTLEDRTVRFKNTRQATENGIALVPESRKEQGLILDSPVMILAHTIKGKGVSFMENQASWYGHAPSKQEYEAALGELEAWMGTLEVE